MNDRPLLPSLKPDFRLYLFFSLLFIAAFAATTLLYLRVEAGVKKRIYAELSAIADLKLGQIVEWRNDRLGFAKTMIDDPFLIEALRRWSNDRSNRTLGNELRRWMANTGSLYQFSNVALIDSQCTVLLSAKDSASLADPVLQAAVGSAASGAGPQFTDLHRSVKGDIQIDLVAPFGAPAGNGLLLVIEIDPDKFLFPLIQSWPMPSLTAETLLLHVSGDSIEYLNELRHLKNSALSFRLPLNKKGLLAVDAVRQGKGVYDRVDYRDKPVLGAVRSIPGSPWYMVAKVDKDEIMKPVNQLFLIFLAFALLTAACMIISFLLIYRHQRALYYQSLYNAEQEKSRSEARFRSLFNSMTEGFALHEIVYDQGGKPVDYRIIDVNPAFTKHTGITVEKATGRLATELYSSPMPPYFEEYLRVTRTQKPFSFETFYPPMGKHFSISAFSPGIDLFATVFEDITRQKNTEEERKLTIEALVSSEKRLAEEKERLLVTLRSIGDGVITTNVEGTITLMNKVAEHLTGWDFSESIGRPLSEVFHIINEKTRARCENPVEKALTTGGIVGLANHTSLISKNGRERIIADSGAPIRDARSNIIGVVLVFRDVTDKQKTEEALRNAQKIESIGVLAGGIAHDFNNLLGGIFGYISLAIDEGGDRKTAGYLAKAMDTMERARELTRQLLTFAKGGAPARQRGGLFPFVQEAARFALSGANVSCSFDVQNGLWPCDFEKNQIGQVVDNIVINAQQAMPRGGVIAITAQNMTLKELQVATLGAGRYVRISVKDSGIGIPADILPRIFDPFFTTKQKGSGLGLATSFSIMTRHNGYIDVESTPGKGTTFHLYLPASDENGESAAPAGAEVIRHKGAGRVLVMDDEEVMRDIVGNMLESLGYAVTRLGDGNAVLLHFHDARVKGESIAAIILDLTIPGGMGGKETAQAIRKIDGKVPIFISSGYAEDPMLAEPEKYGCTGSISKPYIKSELAALLEKHLGEGTLGAR
jgi:PAS domain S-box-containing protein